MDIKSILEKLNEAYNADPVAIQCLLCFQLPVNEKIADHPTIQVGMFENGYTMSFLGLLNGLVGNDNEMICTKWSEKPINKEGEYKFLGFDIVKPTWEEA